MNALNSILIFIAFTSGHVIGSRGQEETSFIGLHEPTNIKIWDSTDVCDDQVISFFRPFLPGTWRMLGATAQLNDKWSSDEPIWIYKDMDPVESDDILIAPKNWMFIWDNRNIDSAAPASIWRPDCPNGYTSLGDVICPSILQGTPCEDVVYNTSCVKTSLTSMCQYGENLWQCDGAILGGYDLSVWSIVPIPGNENVTTGFFAANRQKHAAPTAPPRCLDNDVFIDFT